MHPYAVRLAVVVVIVAVVAVITADDDDVAGLVTLPTGSTHSPNSRAPDGNLLGPSTPPVVVIVIIVISIAISPALLTLAPAALVIVIIVVGEASRREREQRNEDAQENRRKHVRAKHGSSLNLPVGWAACRATMPLADQCPSFHLTPGSKACYCATIE
jgi:hypothetical protein